MTITGLELQKQTWGAIWGGIRFQGYGNGGGFWHRGKCDKQARNSSCPCGGNWCLLPIESDNGVALDELVKFCGHKLGWRVEETDTVRCMIFRRGMIVGNQDMTVGFAKGETPADAICRALIQAASVKV